jgi:hypothetical protein
MLFSFLLFADSFNRSFGAETHGCLCGSQGSGDFTPPELAVTEQQSQAHVRRFALQDYLQIQSTINLNLRVSYWRRGQFFARSDKDHSAIGPAPAPNLLQDKALQKLRYLLRSKRVSSF